MDPSTTHHQEMMGSDQQSLESILAGPTKCEQEAEAAAKKPRPQHEQALKCPRCESTNTKFCYYNNYSLSQPRYFCKSCRRYWTKGGTLRNVPVGGGCRKSKRPSSSKRITITAAHQDGQEHQHSHQLQDLIALNSNSNPNPLAGFHSLAYEASFQGENFHLPLTFADQLHKLSGAGQSDGHDFPMHLGFPEAQSMNSLQGLYYGLGDGINADGGAMSGELMLPYEETKPDFCSSESRVLWGFPWPANADGIGNAGDLGSIRGTWNNVGFSSSWHGLLNSPLM